MWTSSITERSYFHGELKVTVLYTDGTQTFPETYLISSSEDLEVKIKAKLTQLEKLEVLATEILVGEYTPQADALSAVEALMAIEKGYRELELKIITQAEYDTILSDNKTVVKN